jgi:hypothetical protein
VKRSLSVKLILLGTVAVTVAGCDQESDTQKVELTQQTYATQSECMDDWGDADNCKPVDASQATSGTAHGSAYVGPRYYWDRGLGYPVIVDSSGTSRVATTSRMTSSGSTIARSMAASTVSEAAVGHASVSSISRGGFGGTAHGFSSAGG